MEIAISYKHCEAQLRTLPLEALALFVLEKEGAPENSELSVAFVNNDDMTRLNGTFRGIEQPTDVLAFEGDYTCEATPDEQNILCPLQLGDVAIAPDVAHKQTTIYGTTFEGEITLLLVHGILHLLGYDHVREEDALIMEAREAELLNAWADLRGVAHSVFGCFNDGITQVRGKH